MGEKMSLQAVCDSIRYAYHDGGNVDFSDLRRWVDAIDAHLTQPAQAVDVGAIREVIAELSNPSVLHAPYVTRCADKLTAALPNANGKEG